MGDGQNIICEIDEQNVVGDGMAYMPASLASAQACCSSPCAIPEKFERCVSPPTYSCGDGCNCSKVCYQQPARAQSYKPPSTYVHPCCNMDTETVYKRSYLCVDPSAAKSSRLPPVRNPDTFNPFQGSMDNKTIQKLSYPGHCGVSPAKPVLPRINAIGFTGTIAQITSQKHDFVPKPYSMRKPILPTNGMCKVNAPMDKCTINKLSYQPYDISQNPPPKQLLQGASYIRPTEPGEKCTIQKLSYLPVCLPSKEDLPWAKQLRVQPPPCRPMCTTYKLSYLPNCTPQRALPIEPISAIKIFGTDLPKNNTVYKLSYVCTNGRRPDPILPKAGLCLLSGSIEKSTTYKLSYVPNCNIERTDPIKPREQTCRASGPIQKVTTQKNDFVPKPCSRRELILPTISLCSPSVPMDKCTVNKLSYIPVDICRFPPPAPIRPNNGLTLPKSPIDNSTTYKLSYAPVCTQPRQTPPWALKSSYVKPMAPMEKCTIQKLSYVAPGRFSCNGYPCDCRKTTDCFPRAGIC